MRILCPACRFPLGIRHKLPHTRKRGSIGCSVDSLICLKPNRAITSEANAKVVTTMKPPCEPMRSMNCPAIAEPTEPPIEFIAPIQAMPSVKRVGGTRCSISWLPFTHVGAWQTPMHR